MPRNIVKRSKKSGLPPGTLIQIGKPQSEKTRITLLAYGDGPNREEDVTDAVPTRPPIDQPGVTWLHVDGLADVAALERLGCAFGVHPLIMEDILNTDQRPKVEDSGDDLFIVLKMFYLETPPDGEILPEQISIILGPNYILSFQEKEGPLFLSLRERIRSCQGRLCKAGSDYLAYSLIDNIVDSYFLILEMLGEQIEEAEEALMKNPSRQTLQVIRYLKREMIFLRKSIWPLREVVNYLERMESPLLHPATRIYFKDVYDHTIQIMDTVETYRDMLSGMLDIYLSSMSNRLNEVMKVLTIIATIFMPLTFLAGVYGMNFKFLPELEWHYGYLTFWIVNVTLAVLMLIYFKRKKWL